MGRKTVSGIVLTLLLIGTLAWAFNIQPVKAAPTTIRVPTDYPTIQAAINVANLGDTVFVCNGTYCENIVVNKTVSILGEGRENTIVDGGGIRTVVLISADNVVLRNFSIQNSSRAYGFAGVAVFHRNNVKIEDNNIRNNNVSIVIEYSKDIKVERNLVSDSYGGIIINYSQNITVTENHVSNNSYGILLYASRNSKLEGNVMADNVYNFGVNGASLSDFSNYVSPSNTVNGKAVYYLVNKSNLEINPSTYPNLGYLALINSTQIAIQSLNVTQNFHGILLVNTDNSKINNVYVARNYGGIIVYLSSNITVETSTIFRNTESGIYLGDSENSKIVLNSVASHTLQKWSNGIELNHSKNITVTENNILNNKFGMFLYFSNENHIYWNNFVENTFQVGTYASYKNAWDDGYPSGGNYWSDYNGKDLYGGPYQNVTGSDGIGDIPYVIVSVVSYENYQDNYPLIEPWSAPTMTKTFIRTIRFWDLPKGTENSLTSKLEGTLHLLDIENENGAVHKLMGFANQVEALRNKKLTNEQADCLISEAQRIIDFIEG